MSSYTFKTAGLAHPVEIVAYTHIKPGAVALAMYTGSASMQATLSADELGTLIENLNAARDELIRAEFAFPAIEAIEVAA